MIITFTVREWSFS